MSKKSLILILLCVFTALMAASCGPKLVKIGSPMSITATGGVFQGVVLSTTGGKLSGAIVLLKEVNISDTTDLNGEFIISGIPTGHFQLVTSLAGYDTTFSEISLNGGWFTPGTISLKKSQSPVEGK